MSPAAPRYLDLRLLPHRSLSPRGFRILIGAVAVICGLNAARFLALDAWPVALFLLLDVALIYGAFKLNYRSGRSFEELRLDDQALTVRRVDMHGRQNVVGFQPHWVRVDLETPSPDENRLRLSSHGRSVEVGRFLAPFERIDVKGEIEAGLARFRQGRALGEAMPPDAGP